MRLGLQRPCSAGGPCSATEIQNGCISGNIGAESAHNLAHKKKVKGTKIQSESRTLSGAPECSPTLDAFSTLDIQRRKRLDSLPDFLKAQLFQVATLQRLEPLNKENIMHDSEDSPFEGQSTAHSSY
jgi:hypothetical protein